MFDRTRKSLPRIRRIRLNIIRLFDRSLFERELRFELGQSGGDEKIESALKSLATITTQLTLLQIGLDALRQVSAASDKVAEVQTELLGHLMTRADLLLRRSSLIPLGTEFLLLTSYGVLLLPSEDCMLVIAASESGGVLEPGTIEVLKSLIQEGDCVLDIGANIGLTVIPAARQVGVTGEVIAFEPASRAASLLRQSLALNSLSERVTLHQNAAGEVGGRAQLHIGRILGQSSLLPIEDSTGQEEVVVETVDSLVPQGRRVRLVKIDAEGYEVLVWRGMQRVIAENPEMIVIVEFGPSHLARAGVNVESWIDQFHASGFDLYEIDESTSCLRPLRPLEELAAVHSLNLLMSRQRPNALPMLRFE